MTIRTPLVALGLLGLGGLLGYLLAQQGAGHSMPTMAPSDGMAAAERCPDGSAPDYWVAPMDAAYRRDGPGKSPMGMDLVPFCGSSSAADVSISPQLVQNLGIRTAAVRRQALSQNIAGVGYVQWDQSSFHMLHTRAEGWLEEVGVASRGEVVAAGDLLYRLFSPKLIAAERELLAAGANRLLRRAAQDRLRSLGYTEAQIKALNQGESSSNTQDYRAPHAGVVVELGARHGQFVTPGSHVMTLADPSEVWMLVEVAERDAGGVALGQLARVRVDAYPGREWQGQVNFIDPELNPVTRTLRVRLTVANADGALRPGMFAGADIEVPVSAVALVVPRAAVIRASQGARVVKALGAGEFDVVAIRTGAHGADGVQVLSGLRADDQVVVSGQFLLDSEANVDAELLRLAAQSAPRGEAEALVKSVNIRRRQLKLKHGPFEPIGADGFAMPAMTMRFAIAEELDLTEVRKGDRLRVVVEKAADGRYVVTGYESIPAKPPAAAPPGEGEAHHHAQSMAAPPAAAPMADAIVRGVFPEDREITLEHGYIESLGMPEMTMGFVVAEDVPLEGWKPGDHIRFRADSPERGVYRVTHIEAAP